MTRRRWVLHDLNSRFNCLNPRYNVGTPFFALVDDYADERPKDRGAPVTYGDDRSKRRHTYGDGRPKDRGAPVPLHSRGARRRFNCLNPCYNVGTPFFALVDDYADERPKDRGALEPWVRTNSAKDYA